MKKIITLVLVLTLCLSMTVPVSAVTTGNWDFEAGAESAQDAAQDYLANQEHSVHYDLNGGFIWNYSASPSFQTELNYTEKGTHTVISTTPIRPLYTLVGWEYDGNVYQAGDVITLTEDVTLTAVWEQNYGASGSETPDADESEKVELGVTTITESSFYHTGYVASLKNRLQIKWDAVENAESYEIEVVKADGTTTIYTSTSTSLIVKNAECPKVYVEATSTWTAATVRVRAIAEDVTGDWSEAEEIGCDAIH